MTTESGDLSLDRASCADVPLLRSVSAELSDIDVLGIEVNRSSVAGLTPAAGVAEAAHAASQALSLLSDELWGLMLVAASWPTQPPNRLAASLAMKHRVWGQWERESVMLPVGARHDFPLTRSDDRLRFAGWLDCDIEEFGVAIEVTRTHPALCVLHPESVSGDLHSVIDRALQGLGDPDPDGGELLRRLIPALQLGALIVRGFGVFDDRRVGVDIYAQARRIDAIEDKLPGQAQ
ncbi:hypothetical protein ACFWPA_08525 [Rhodococcus sp. NPDC058505]|uniref:hypothetical protein n=1 Tax=Rhodococcus sp. NPDC058505 TaxID=3346531 RepID=UPI00364E9D32